MSTRKVVDQIVVAPGSTFRLDVGEFVVRSGEALNAFSAWLVLHMSRLTSPLFTNQQAYFVYVPVPVRTDHGRNTSWR